ncbi:hypothetical protein MKX03_015840 [Papaver bracteatum]|nr:hypothetical protein MKX03_015840 [Papaver bracteatum]
MEIKLGVSLILLTGMINREMPPLKALLYDSTGKLLPINFDKQREQVPTIEENIDVRANIIFLDRDYLEEADPHIPSQQETVSSSASSTQEEESRPEGQNNPEAVPKKRRWFKPFSWWQKK